MSRLHGNREFWLAALRAEAAAFIDAVSESDQVNAPVPSCPGWSVGELVRHLGSVYRRTRLNLVSGHADAHWGPVVIPDDAPAADDPGVVAWFAVESSDLDTVLDAVDPDLPAWNWAPQARVATFWHRRMAHETAVHRWDAQLARALPEPLEAKLAGDTVAEVLDTFLPAGRRAPVPEDVAGLAHLQATDLGHEWYVRLRATGIALLDTDTLLDYDEHPARVRASGSASDLALALWGRLAFDVLETEGDVALLEALRAS